MEILAGRVLAPVFGNSVATWCAAISVVLAGLGLGYPFGGRLSIRNDLHRMIGITLLVIGGWFMILPFVGNSILLYSENTFGSHYGVLAAATYLFFSPAFCLATMTPLFVEELKRLQTDVNAGNVAGRLFGWSTMGSLIGSIAAGFVLLRYFSLSGIFLGMALTMCLVSLYLRPRQVKLLIVALLLLTLTVALLIFRPEKKLAAAQIFHQQTYYHQICVTEQNGWRGLFLDRGLNSLVASDAQLTNKLTYATSVPLLENLLEDGGRYRGLVIGGGGYVIPRDIVRRWPDVDLTVMEIDPEVTAVATKYFDWQPGRQTRVIHGDGRQLLRQESESYDWIWLDAFRDFSAIPEHLLSLEAFELYRAKLRQSDGQTENSGGMDLRPPFLLVNMVVKEPPGAVFASVVRTVMAVFKEVKVLRIKESWSEDFVNALIVAADEKLPLDAFDSTAEVSLVEDLPTTGTLLTDDYNPLRQLAIIR